MPLIQRKHTTAKAYVHDWLEPDQPGGINFFSGAIIILVIVSLISLALETELLRDDSGIDRGLLPLVQWLNVAIVWVFAIEFALRFWSEGENPAHAGVIGRLRFLIQPVTIADVLAFAPELVAMIFFPDTTGAWFPALRALRLFRLFKLARYVPAFAIVGAAVRRAWAPLMAALAVAAAQLYIAAMLLYFIEGDSKPEAFGSIARAMWWAIVTLTTVGYGDVYPETALGRFAAGLVALAGVGIVALPTGILASSFAEEFRERHEASKRALEERRKK
ncbi:ion transporter [Terricaulis sp.]|uniref:ion transporter n=1 Tax=Terricaulis sp. TaxID=2768686 RepID=UPI002AC42DD4|nr:ion transporter [Terricaulis sp.]MDZ4692447.1 ion transporter [Terricaulis sp.]